MGYEVGVVLLVLVIVVFIWLIRSQSERFDAAHDLGLGPGTSIDTEAAVTSQTNNSMPIDVTSVSPEDQPYIRLYEDYRGGKLAYEYSPKSGHGYHRQMIPIELKHIEAYLPKTASGPYEQIRTIGIWSIYGGAPNASTLSDFYNAYLEPGFELRANPAKYKPILTLQPGQRVSIDVTEPTKKIFLIAVM